MLSFGVDNGRTAKDVSLAGAYVVGSDGVALRADIEIKNEAVLCQKRAQGPAGLALLWPVAGYGALLLETSRLVERPKPYNLVLELVRGRLTRISQKREEWGLFDYEGFESLASDIDKARDLFVEAVKADLPADQSTLAGRALQGAVLAGEKLSLFHADILLARRKTIHRRMFGCAVDPLNTADEYRGRVREGFDYVHLPIPWRQLEPKEQEFNWRPFDNWIEWSAKNKVPMHIGPLISFHDRHLPDWLAMYETDFDTVRNLIFDHVRRVVERYANYVFHWDVISGIHADNAFSFTFEQLMELTRMTVAAVKQLAPRAQAAIDLIAPWGEYYARNQRTIPPMLYAEMVVQSGVSFDGFGAEFVFGAPQDGLFVRDMFQISEKLDRLGGFGKPVHITAVQVPSSSEGPAGTAGAWRRNWDEEVQAQWIKEFYSIALSKPFIESITWADLSDKGSNSQVTAGGLLDAELKPKKGHAVLVGIRNQLQNLGRRPPAQRLA